MGEGSFSLMGHPEDDGNPVAIAGVWHDLRVQENSPVADLYLVGDHGSHILEILEAGGSLGTSSSGYGKIESDGKTVIAESYDLERIGDIVLAPSQQVFMDSSLLKTEEKQTENVKQAPSATP